MAHRLDREPFHTPEQPDPEMRETWQGGHALVIQYGDCEFYSNCQCGASIDFSRPDQFRPDRVMAAWEHHCMTLGR